MNLFFLNVDSIPSRPIVGSIIKGTGEKIRIASLRSSLFINLATGPAHKNRKAENIAPSTKKIFVIFFIRCFACAMSTLGKKYENAFGNPKVKTVSNVLYTYITCLYVP